ncbi:MAG: PEP-CTERM sorting domain-containing protein [Phycisphaerales bacterium]
MTCISTIRIAALATALTSSIVSSAGAAVVSSGPVNITIPGVPPGVFLNVVTGQFGTSFTGVPGADVNLFGFGSTLTVSGPVVNGAQSPTGGFARLNDGLNVANLASGGVVGDLPGMFWQTVNAGITTTSPAGSPFFLNSTNNYAGFRFLNENTGQVHYGYLRLSIGATLATRSIIEYAYEDVAGASILVPAPSALALLGAAGIVGSRRRR